MRTLLLALVLLLATVLPARAERLISAISRNDVSITSSFQGETLTFFGNVEP
ncbi:MAG TPA: TIGR02186 family protein, partial [Alphaproteobacteria bacterium]|nr:TIGR02186 family protein [Alphaproteobacteria bacterium]